MYLEKISSSNPESVCSKVCSSWEIISYSTKLLITLLNKTMLLLTKKKYLSQANSNRKTSLIYKQKSNIFLIVKTPLLTFISIWFSEKSRLLYLSLKIYIIFYYYFLVWFFALKCVDICCPPLWELLMADFQYLWFADRIWWKVSRNTGRAKLEICV